MDTVQLEKFLQIDKNKKQIKGNNGFSVRFLKSIKDSNTLVHLYNIDGENIITKFSLNNCSKVEREIEVLRKLRKENIGMIDGILLPKEVLLRVKDSEEKITVLLSLYSGESLTNILKSDFQITPELLGKILFSLGRILKKLHRSKEFDKMNSWTQTTFDQVMFGEDPGPTWQQKKIKDTKDFIHKHFSNEIINEIEYCKPSWTHGDFFPHQILILQTKPDKISIIDWDAANKGLGLSDLAQFWASFELALLFSGRRSEIENLLKLFEKGYEYDLSNSLLFRLLELNALFRFSPLFKKGLGVIPRSKNWNVKSGKSKYLHYSYWYSIYLHEELINERILQINQLCHNQKVSS